MVVAEVILPNRLPQLAGNHKTFSRPRLLSALLVSDSARLPKGASSVIDTAHAPRCRCSMQNIPSFKTTMKEVYNSVDRTKQVLNCRTFLGLVPDK